MRRGDVGHSGGELADRVVDGDGLVGRSAFETRAHHEHAHQALLVAHQGTCAPTHGLGAFARDGYRPLLESFEPTRQRARVRWSGVRLFGEHGEAELVDLGRDGLPYGRRRNGRIAHHRPQELEQGCRFEGRASREALVEDATETVDVGAFVDSSVSGGLLGGHVMRCAHRRELAFEPWGLRRSEVDELELVEAPGRQEQVGGFQVGVDDARRVQRFEGLGGGGHQRQRLADRGTHTAEASIEILAFEPLEHQVAPSLVMAVSVKAYDAGRLDQAQYLRLHLEPSRHLVLPPERQLHGHPGAVALVDGAEHGAHSATSGESLEAVSIRYALAGLHPWGV